MIDDNRSTVKFYYNSEYLYIVYSHNEDGEDGRWIEWYENGQEREEYAFYDKVHIYKWIKLIVSIILICAVF